METATISEETRQILLSVGYLRDAGEVFFAVLRKAYGVDNIILEDIISKFSELTFEAEKLALNELSALFSEKLYDTDWGGTF